MELKVGDKVKVVSLLGGHEFKLGEIVTLDKLNLDGVHIFKSEETEHWWYMNPERYEIIKGDDEVVEFKIGDKVRVIGDVGFYDDYLGEIGEVCAVNIDDYFPIGVMFQNKSCDWGKFEDLELVHSTMKKETFKIEQVIEMMREDNSRKFQSAIDSEGDYIQIEGEEIVWRGHKQSGQVFKLGLLDDLWVEYDEIEEVEPKTFQEVLEEVSNTPDIILIKMEHRFQDLDYQNLEDMLREMTDIWFSDDISKILLEGKYYTKKL